MFQFNIYAVPPLSASILLFSLGTFVLLNNIKSKTNITFAILNYCTVIWLLGYFVMYSITDKNIALCCAKILYIGVIFIPFVFYHFIIHFLKIKNNGFIIRLNYLLGIIFSLLVLKTNLIVEGLYSYFWGYQTKIGSLHSLFLAIFLFLFIRCFYFLRKKRREVMAISYTEANRINYVFWAFIIAILSSADYLPNYGIKFYPLGFFTMSIFVVVTSYAIVRHRLMEIEVIIKKTLVYSILISLITIIYFMAVYVLERLFSVVIGYQSIPLAIAIIAIFSMIFIPLRNKIQHIIDKRFFKGTIDQIEHEKELLKTELQRSERLKSISTLAAGMAHEIKNPLTSIKTFAEYLEKKYNDPAFRTKFKNIVPREIDKISNIINQLLDYSKVDKVSLKANNVHSILDYILDLYNNEFLRKHIKVQKSYSSQFPIITCDENQIKQAFINIVLNSIEAMPNGGELIVQTNNIGSILEVSIKDTGTGIPSDKLKCLFDPFYTTKQKGTGLGLFIVHQIIENNKGKISINSEIEKGTVVQVEFSR